MKNLTIGHTLATITLCSLVLSGCDGSSRSPTGPTSSTPAAPTPSPAGQVLQIGQPINGTITSSDPECRFSTVDGVWGGLCQSFTITAPATGTLVVTVRSTSSAALSIFFKTPEGEQIDLFCCGPSLSGRMPAQAGASYRVELAYSGRPPGYPNVPPVPFTLEAAIVIGGSEPREALSTIIFGDPSHTQRLANARLEILDGPLTGTVARFDERTGLYVIPNVPAGLVQVRASAAGFEPLDAQLRVPSNIVSELALQRTEPLADATHTLTGMVRRANSNAFLVDVKIEILDGPLAGVFTFTDEDMAMYSLRNLPAGVVEVRASLNGLSQTLAVEVSGSTTTLNFELGQ
jgi:hypothetical protein